MRTRKSVCFVRCSIHRAQDSLCKGGPQIREGKEEGRVRATVPSFQLHSRPLPRAVPDPGPLNTSQTGSKQKSLESRQPPPWVPALLGVCRRYKAARAQESAGLVFQSQLPTCLLSDHQQVAKPFCGWRVNQPNPSGSWGLCEETSVTQTPS